MIAEAATIIVESNFNPFDFSIDGNDEADKIFSTDPNDVSVYISSRFLPELGRKNAVEKVNAVFISCFGAFRGKLPPHIVFDEITEYYSLCPEKCWAMLCHTVREEIYRALPDIKGMRRPDESTVRQKSFRQF